MENEPSNIAEFARTAVMVPALTAYAAASIHGAFMAKTLLENGLDHPEAAGSMIIAMGVIAASSIALLGARNFKSEDLSASAAKIKNFGNAILDGVSELGQRMHLLKKNESPTVKSLEYKLAEQSSWAKTAKDALKMALPPISGLASMCSAGGLLSLPAIISNSQLLSALPVLAGATALAAGSVYAGLKILKTDKDQTTSIAEDNDFKKASPVESDSAYALRIG